MAWLSAVPDKDDKPRRAQYIEGSPYLDLPLLSSYQQTLLTYWYELGTCKQTGQGIVGLEWDEITAWANHFYSEQYIEWVEHPRPLREDGLPDERFKRIYTPISITQCTLLDWELQVLKRMSQEYAQEYGAAVDPSRPCPKDVDIEEMSEEDKLDNSTKLGDSLIALFGGAKEDVVHDNKSPAD